MNNVSYCKEDSYDCLNLLKENPICLACFKAVGKKLLILCSLLSEIYPFVFTIFLNLLLLQGDSLVAHFEYHKQPITSIEWSPHEASTIAVSSADNQLT